MKNLCSLAIASILLVTSAFANEPVNLEITKQQLKRYHDSGAYMDDFANVIQKAMRYLELRIERQDFRGRKPAIILDIDETALSNYSNILRLDFAGSIEKIRQGEELDEVLPATLKLYRYAKANKIAVIFLTCRFEEERQETEAHLKKAGFVNFDGLILRDGIYKKISASAYKTAMRKQLYDQGYTILLNLGDQKSDLKGGYADKSFKLPNPYYLIP
jgi:predicted secreted acid phosphatase